MVFYMKKYVHGDLHENVPNRLTGGETIGRCGVIGVGMFLLEELCHWCWSFRFQRLKPVLVSFSSIAINPDIELSTTVSACMLPRFPL